MPDKSTAVMMQLTTSDGNSKQQMVVFANKAVFRRSLTEGSRTRWRHASVGDLPEWVEGYVSLTKAAPSPMSVSHGATLMEVTEDELAEAESTVFSRKVGLRFQRVLDGMDDDPATNVPVEDIKAYMTEWLDANERDDNGWIDAHVHPSGTAVVKPAAPEPEPEEEPEVAVPSISSGWSYPATVRGYITRPNGQRYKVRMLDGSPDVQVLRDARPDREHVFLRGEPGTGKTALVDSAFGTDLVTMLGTEDTEVADFIGGYTPRPGATPPYAWTDGALTEAMERKVPLFIDEVGVIAPKVMTTVFSVMDGRDELRITANPARGIVSAGHGFMVIAATNPHAPGVRLSEALLSRFAIHLEVGSDYSVCREMGVPDVLVTAAENLDKRRTTGEIGWAPQMRELLQAKAQWDKRGDVFAIRNLISGAPEDDRDVVQEVLRSATGKRVTGLVL